MKRLAAFLTPAFAAAMIWLPAAVRSFRSVFPLAMAALFAAFLAGLTLVYGGRLVQSRQWVDAHHNPVDTSRSLEDMFNLANGNGLLRVEFDGKTKVPHIGVKDCSERFRDPPALPAEQDNALKVLCDTPQGSQLIEEIDQWNTSYDLLAVRDDIGSPEGKAPPSGFRSRGRRLAPPDKGEQLCDNGRDAVGSYLAFGCRASHWTASLSSVSFGSVPLRDYAMVAAQRRTWMNDWMLVRPPSDADDSSGPVVSLTAETPEGTAKATFHLIGDLKSLKIDGSDAAIPDCNHVDALTPLGRPPAELKVRVSLLYAFVRRSTRFRPRGRDIDDPSSCKTSGRPLAYAVTVTSSGSAAWAKHKVALQASGRQTLPSWDQKGSNGNLHWELRRTANIIATCNDQPPGPEPPAAENPPPINASFRKGPPQQRSQQTAAAAGKTCKAPLLKWIQPPDEAPSNLILTAETADPAGASAQAENSRAPAQNGPRVRRRFVITDRNGTLLTSEDNGRILPEAANIGLAPIVGLGAGDIGGLSAALNNIRAPAVAAAASSTSNPAIPESQKFKLSIDFEMQRIVNGVLRDRFKLGNDDDEGRRPQRQHQRAAVILLDASESPGDPAGRILAAASLPALPSTQASDRYNIWDLRAQLEGRATEKESPLLPQAWQAPDATMPGSTFKLVTSLAAIDYALDHNSDAGFSDLLKGTEIGRARQLLGLKSLPDADVVSVPLVDGVDDAKCPAPRVCQDIHNDGKEYRLDSVMPPSQDCHDPPDGETAAKRKIGLCEALITSSNLYFAGLARRMDQPKVMEAPGSSRESRKDTPGLAMAETARRFMSDRNTTPLLEGVPETVSRSASRLMADRLRVQAAQALDLRGNRLNRRLDVAFSGFGQTVYASPLAMATIYGSFAAGHVIKPRLTMAADADKHPATPLLTHGSGKEQGDYLGLVQKGLSGVVYSGVGTAHGMGVKNRFEDRLRDPASGRIVVVRRLFAKTGTATIGNGRLPTAWLAGWVEPSAAGQNARGQATSSQTPSIQPTIQTRIAFACMVPEGGYGAKTCVPIVNAILEKLEGVQEIRSSPAQRKLKKLKQRRRG